MRLLLPLLIAQNVCWVLAGEDIAGADSTEAHLAEKVGEDKASADSTAADPSEKAGAAEAAPAGVTKQSNLPTKTKAPSVPDATQKKAPSVPDATQKKAPSLPDATQKKAPSVPDATQKKAPSVPDAAKKEAPSVPDAAKKEAAEATAKLVRKIADLEAQLATKQIQLDGQTKKIGDLVQNHEEDQAVSQSLLEEQATTISGLKSQVSSLTSQLDEEKQAHAETKQKASDKDVKMQDLAEQMKKQTREKEHAETEGKNLQEEMTREVSRFRDQVATQEASINELKETLRLGAEDNRQLKNRGQLMEDSFFNLSALYADPSIQHFLTAKAIKVAKDPGVAGAVNKTYVYVLPSLRHRYGEGENLITNSTSFLQSKLNAFIGSEKVDPWLPFASGLLIYGAVFVPLLCAVCCLTKIVCRRRGCLIFWHLYLACTCAYAGFFAFSTGKDTLAAFAMHDGALFLFSQTATGLVLVWYCLLLVAPWCISKSTSSEFFYRSVQVLLVLPVIIPYYFCVWTPAMQDELPRLDEMTFAVVGHRAVRGFVWVPYATSGVIFFLILMLDVLCLRGPKKGQQQQQEVSIGVRNVEDQFSPLAALVGSGGGGDVELGEKSS